MLTLGHGPIGPSAAIISFEALAKPSQLSLLEPVRLVFLYSASTETLLGAGAHGGTATFLLASLTFPCILSHFVSTVVVCQMAKCDFSRRAMDHINPKQQALFTGMGLLASPSG